MIEVPKDVKITEWPATITWFDENEIMCSVYKKGVPRTLEETKQAIEQFKELYKDKKMCMLIDVTNSSETSREIRDYAATELPKIAKAIAMVSDSAVGKMIANLFFTLRTQPYPTKMFNNEKDAKEWLKKFM